jgi:hypothetical protein
MGLVREAPGLKPSLVGSSAASLLLASDDRLSGDGFVGVSGQCGTITRRVRESRLPKVRLSTDLELHPEIAALGVMPRPVGELLFRP